MNLHTDVVASPEQHVDVGRVSLCVQTFGARTDPAVLLVHGASASMLWWEEELCRLLAAGGRFVIRYDQRDTGRSTSFPVGAPGYSDRDLTEDAIGILDALAVNRAHLIGRSMGGAVAVNAGVDHPDRIASLTFVSSTTGDPSLPPPEPGFQSASGPPPDPADHSAVEDWLVTVVRAYYGRSTFFDETGTRALVRADLARTENVAAMMGNHFAIDFLGPRRGDGPADLCVPTLVVHGELDPCFPLPHGEAIRDAVPGARLHILTGCGHEIAPPVWDAFCAAVLEHTESAT